MGAHKEDVFRSWHLRSCQQGPSRRQLHSRSSLGPAIPSTPAPSRCTFLMTAVTCVPFPQISWVVPELLLTAAHAAVLLGSLHALRLPIATRNSSALIFLLLWTW